jgi:transposase
MARKVYTAEFRRSAIALVVDQNSSVKQAAENLGVDVGTLRYWLQQHRDNGGAGNAAEEKDLRKRNAELERENQRLRLERDILKKAAAFFARENL